jgi:hypothetical protein
MKPRNQQKKADCERRSVFVIGQPTIRAAIPEGAVQASAPIVGVKVPSKSAKI